MQSEGTKQAFIMNFRMLDYSDLPPDFSFDFHNFLRGMPLDPLDISSFFLISNPSLCVIKVIL